MSALMGIDVGTGSVKVELVHESGASWTASSAPYGIRTPRTGWAEQDPATWWDAVVTAAGHAWHASGLPEGERVTVALTGQMHTTVLLDSAGRPVRPAVLWCDERASAEAREIADRVPDVESLTGNRPLPAFTAAHLMWLRRHDPAAYERAATLLLPKDLVRRIITGETATDWTDASGTGLLDVRSRQWSAQVVDALGLGAGLLPPVRAPHDLVGEARGLLPAGVRVTAAVGVGDQFAEALSAGLVDEGPLVVVLGTSAVLLRSQRQPGPGVFVHAPDERWLRLESLHAGGLSLAWFRSTFAPNLSYDELLAEAAQVPRGAGGLLYLPFLAGDRTEAATTAGGAFVGARATHHRSHFALAVLEGVAMELRRIAETRMDTPGPAEIVLKGGGARSVLWAQIVADVFAAPVRVSERTAASGAVRVAGVTAGWWHYGDSDGRADERAVEPQPTHVALYRSRYADYVAQVAALADPDVARTATSG